ncbi:MAG: hypothetical protein Q9164_004000 [Protoblastenia rupestris]
MKIPDDFTLQDTPSSPTFVSSPTFEFTCDNFSFPDFTMDGAGSQIAPFPTLGEGLNLDTSKFDVAALMSSSNHTLTNNSTESYDQWFGASDLTFPPVVHGLATPPSSYGTCHMPHMNMPFSISESSSNPIVDSNPHFTDPNSTCMPLALSLLATLHGNATTCSIPMTAAKIPTHKKPRITPTSDEIIATNKVTLDKTMNILKCHCSARNEQLVFFIAFIAFKIMARYAAAAQEGDSKTEGLASSHAFEQVSYVPTTMSDYQLSGNDCGRVRAQLVLGELHRVVRLVEMLSKRLEEVRQNADVPMSGSNGDHGGGKGDCISASVFTQLETDLRNHLRAVTKDTMTILRRV